MELNCEFFLLIFVFILNCSIYNVTSQETELESQRKSVEAALKSLADGKEVRSLEIESDEIKSDEIESNEMTSNEMNSDENVDTGFDSSSEDETSDTMDMTGFQIGADQIAPIINQLLGPLSATIQPYLGPLAPLSSVLSNVISNTVTELVVNLLNETTASAKRQEFLQIRNYTSYTSYLVTVPNNGRFLLLTKTPRTHRKPKQRQKKPEDTVT